MTYFLIDSSGNVIGQFFWNGQDPVPDNAKDIDGLSDVQLHYREHLTWTNDQWVYDGPDSLPDPAPPDDPLQAKRDALSAAGFTSAQIDAILAVMT